MFTRPQAAARSELSIEVASADFDNAAVPQKRNTPHQRGENWVISKRFSCD